MIPRTTVEISEDERLAIERVLKSGQFVKGQEAKALEQEFAELIWGERFGKELDLSKFHQELFDLEEYDKLIVFMESK